MGAAVLFWDLDKDRTRQRAALFFIPIWECRFLKEEWHSGTTGRQNGPLVLDELVALLLHSFVLREIVPRTKQPMVRHVTALLATAEMVLWFFPPVQDLSTIAGDAKPAVLPNFHVRWLRRGLRAPGGPTFHLFAVFLTLILNRGHQGCWCPSWKPLSRGRNTPLARPSEHTQLKT